MQTTLTARRQLQQATQIEKALTKVNDLSSDASKHVSDLKHYIGQKEENDQKLVNAITTLINSYDNREKKRARREFVSKVFGATVMATLVAIYLIQYLIQVANGEENTTFTNTTGNTIVIAMNIAILLGWVCYKYLYNIAKAVIQKCCGKRVTFAPETDETVDLEQAMSTVSDLGKGGGLPKAFSQTSLEGQSHASSRLTLPGVPISDQKDPGSPSIVVPITGAKNPAKQ
jgi:hypothetical protein